jgi:hypothetical protein
LENSSHFKERKWTREKSALEKLSEENIWTDDVGSLRRKGEIAL